MSSFIQFLQVSWFLWHPGPVVALVYFITQVIGFIVAGLALGYALSELEGGYEIR